MLAALEADFAAERDPRGRRALLGALRFTTEGWLARALAAGWTESELVGRDPLAPWARLDRLGAAFFCGEGPPERPWRVVGVAAAEIRFDACGAILRKRRRAPDEALARLNGAGASNSG